MGVKIVVTELRGSSKAVQRKLRHVIRKIKNPVPANRAVSIWLLRWVNENFRSEGGKVGKWKPFKHGGRKLSDGSVDSSAKLLQDTGRLRRSFLPFYSRRVAGVGTSLHYATTHDLGIPFRSIPSRRLLPFDTDKEVERGIIRIYDAYIRRAIR